MTLQKYNKRLLLSLIVVFTSCKALKNTDRISADCPVFNSPLSEVDLYSKNIDVQKLEAFEVDEHGTIYYARLGLARNSKGHKVYIYKAKPNEAPKEHMTLKYFGHPYNISIEEDGGETYVWISSNGSKHENGKYWDEPSVSRIKYQPGKAYGEGYGGETYFLNKKGLQKTQVAVNRKNDLLIIAAESEKGNNWSFYTYKLEEAEALKDSLFTFPVTIGGEKGSKQKEKIVEKEVAGRDLSQLTPLGSFTLEGKRDNKPDSLNSFWMQGFEIDDNKTIYFYEGEGNRKGRKAQAYITALDIKGNSIGERTKIKATESIEDLEDAGITHNSGNIEPEGMAIKGNDIYLGFLAHKVGENNKGKRANIFRYKNSLAK